MAMSPDKKKRLAKLKMPEHRAAMSLDELRHELEAEEPGESPEDEMAESPDHQHMEEMLGVEQHPAMAAAAGEKHSTDNDGEDEDAEEGDEDEDEEDQDGDDSESAEGEEGNLSDSDADHSEDQDMGGDESKQEQHDTEQALARASDADLVAELKKRGLLEELEHEDGHASSGADVSDLDHSGSNDSGSYGA